ncbi:hypothetical protein QYE76_005470, partial [Lolium multiflorum]
MVSSIFGQTEDIWVEGEGMLHALYFTRSNNDTCTWSLSYNNRYVQSDTFMVETARARPCFLSITKGNPLAMLAAVILNMLRFGKVFRNMSNTSVFVHAGRVFAAAENDIPNEIDLQSLDTIGSWSISGDWLMPFTAHPKVVPGSGELVISGINIVKPYLSIGVVSEDGVRLKQKVDLKLDRCTFCHEIGITKMYNIIMDMPLTLDPKRILRAGSLIDYEKETYARIGVMPRNGDAESVLWFHVEPFCTMHLVNCFEEGDEVVVRGFRVPASIIMGPTLDCIDDPSAQDLNEEYFSRLYEWRLNLQSKASKGRWLTGTDIALEFPVINEKYVGLHHRYAYVQVVDVQASFAGGSGTVRPKFGGLAKLHLDQEMKEPGGDVINVEFHHLERNQFCSGATFVAKAN